MTNEIPLLILGAGGTASDVLELFADSTGPDGMRYHVLGLLDDNPDLHGESVGEHRILGSLADLGRWPEAMVADTLGSPRSHRRRAGIIAHLGIDPGRFATLVHPTAVVADSAVIGTGAIVYPHTMIGPRVQLGSHVIVLSHSVVNHDSRIGAYTILASHVACAGRVTVGADCYLGMGSCLIQDAHIGNGALVGMGSVVIRDVASGGVVAGNPATELSTGDHTTE
jgi:sugar O-acyltransferase (sialic acid O-acetyltransferase NeuD family)